MTLFRLIALALIAVSLAALGMSLQGPARPAAGPAETDAKGGIAPVPPLGALAQTRTRPLFTADRRAPPRPREESPSAESGRILGRYDVVGALSLDGEAIIALRALEDGRVLRLRAGDMLDGWRVAEADLTGFRLDRRGETMTVPIGGEP